MKPIVFAGPSLHGIVAPAAPVFDLAPPAAYGDLLAAVQEGRSVIGLIDGVFESGPAVWHQEIMVALRRGCSVFGAASMGALRAAECARFGMIGIGRIYQDYRDGRRSSDADVALVHGPAELGYLPLSLALVDVEDALARMEGEGVLPPDMAAALLRQARRTFFKTRSWAGLFEACGVPPAVVQAITHWTATSGPGLKGRDALLLLEEMQCAVAPRAAC